MYTYQLWQPYIREGVVAFRKFQQQELEKTAEEVLWKDENTYQNTRSTKIDGPHEKKH